MNNNKKFELLRALNLPLLEFVITGSGPLGIRNLKEIGDLDILVSNQLWKLLGDQYGVSVGPSSIKKIVICKELIEAFGEVSFAKLESVPEQYASISTRIRRAEIIEGLPFEPLDAILFFKICEGRKKDLADIQLIKNYLNSQTK